MKWRKTKAPPKNDSMVLVVRKMGDYYLRDYAYYEHGEFRFPYTCLNDYCESDVPYNNVILWRYLPKLPKQIRKKEL